MYRKETTRCPGQEGPGLLRGWQEGLLRGFVPVRVSRAAVQLAPTWQGGSWVPSWSQGFTLTAAPWLLSWSQGIVTKITPARPISFPEQPELRLQGPLPQQGGALCGTRVWGPRPKQAPTPHLWNHPRGLYVAPNTWPTSCV